jgi:hypothetical protein
MVSVLIVQQEALLRFLALTFAVVLGLLLTGTGVHAAAAAKVVKFIAVQVSQKDKKNGFVIKDNDFVGGKKVGTDTINCTLVNQSKANCVLLVVRPSGTIRGSLVLSFSASQGKGKITGGTGAYAGAKGTLTFKNLNEDGTRTSVVLTLA